MRAIFNHLGAHDVFFKAFRSDLPIAIGSVSVVVVVTLHCRLQCHQEPKTRSLTAGHRISFSAHLLEAYFSKSLTQAGIQIMSLVTIPEDSALGRKYIW